MASFATFFSCFSDSTNKIACEGEDSAHSKRMNEAQDVKEAKSKNKSKRKPPPIPVSYFPVGTRFSQI
ncbi:hypothetical protein CJ030_MR2G025890 [Morella rubra]|uniref:Uncharacterized protein n=1 Tax=Morella rubra TaxID=262757 RepID=A0A6A1WBV8_9ROSI|nr:hypothetical protein CJ030_MR2G025890 [Morella rubra]